MLLALFVATAIFGSFFAIRLGLPRLNVMTVFSAIWVPVVLVASQAGAVMPGLGLGSWTLFLVGLLGLLVGTLVVAGRPSTVRVESKVDMAGMRKAHFIFCAILALYVLWQYYQILQKGISLTDVFFANDNSGNKYRWSFFYEQEDVDASTFESTGLIRGGVSWLLFFGNVSIFTGACLWVAKRRALAVIPLVLSAAFSVLTVQRASFFWAMLLFAFTAVSLRRSTFIDVNAPRPKTARSPLRILGAALAVAFAAFVLIYPDTVRTRGTNEEATTFLKFQYLFSGIGGLNYRDETDSRSSLYFNVDSAAADATPGSNTFTEFFSILRRFDMPIKTAPTHYDWYSVDILGSPFSTNTNTMFLDFWLDFGLIGVFIVSFALAALATLVQRFAWQGKVAAAPLFAFIMTGITYSIIATAMIGSFRYLLVIGAATLVLSRFVKQSPVPDATEAGEVALHGTRVGGEASLRTPAVAASG